MKAENIWIGGVAIFMLANIMFFFLTIREENSLKKKKKTKQLNLKLKIGN